jgi:hypothetical protein
MQKFLYKTYDETIITTFRKNQCISRKKLMYIKLDIPNITYYVDKNT